MKKRILALFMSLCMIFSMVPVLGASAAGTEVEFSLATNLDYPFRYNNELFMFLNLEGVTDLSTAIDGATVTATVNGEPTTMTAYYADAYACLQLATGLTDAAGTYLIEIDAGTAVGSYIVKSDLKVHYSNWVSKQLEIVRLGIDTAKGTLGNGMTPSFGGVARYLIYLTGISSYDNWNIEQTALLNGTAQSHKGSAGKFHYNMDAGAQGLYVYYDFLKSGATAPDQITDVQTVSIPAGTIFGDCITENTLTFTIQAYTLNVLPTEINIESTASSGWSGSQYILYLHTDLPFTVSAVQHTTVLVNDEEKTVYLYPANETAPFLACDKAIAYGENKIVIPKGTKLGDCVTAADYTFYTHEDGSIDQIAPPAAVNFTFASGTWHENPEEGLARYLVRLDHDLGSATGVTWTPQNVLTVDSTDKSVFAYDESPSQITLVLDSVVGITEKGEHTVTLKKGTYIGEHEIANDVTFYTHEDGTVDQTPRVDFTFDHGQWQASSNRYLVYLNHNLGVEKDFTGCYTDILTMDDAAVTVETSTNDAKTQLMLVLNSVVGITAQGEHKFVLKKDTLIGNYKIANDVTFYTHADGTVDQTPPGIKVNISGINQTHTGHNGAEYHVYLDMDSTFELAQANNGMTASVLADGAQKAVNFWMNGAGSLLVTVSMAKGYHNITIPAGTVIGDYVLENAYTFRTYSSGAVGESDAGEITLNNATAMMGGSYGDGLYYDMSGSFTGANWIVNATPTNSDVFFEYVKISETKATGYYGPARLVHLNNQYPSVFGVVMFTASTTFANEYGLTNMKWLYDVSEHTAHYHNAAGTKSDPTNYGYQSEWDAYAGDNKLTTKDFAGIDEKGAQYFGVGWNITDGVSAHTIDWTKVMVYDADGNDLGVVWYDSGADVTLTPMVEYGKTVYLKPADNNGLKVVGWKVIDREGKQIPVTATEDANGVWSFVAPEDTASIEPVYHSVELTVTDAGGNVLVHSNIPWLNGDIALAEKQVQAAIPAGYVLKGYSYNGSLYASLEDIDTTGLTKLTVTADMVQFSVQPQGDVRHGNTLADSGLRFVAMLGQTEYIPKVLLISDSKETLTVGSAQWKIGNPFNTDFKQIVTSDTVYYSIVLTNIPDVDYSKTYYARAGILVTYADGTQDYIYTDAVAATVNEAAENSDIISDARTTFVDGVMNLDADAKLVGERSYTVTSNNADGTYTITYTGSTAKVSGLIIDGLRFTAADGVTFDSNTVTVPSSLFANAKLKKELTATGSMDIGAYFGPAVGLYQYTESSGVVTDYSIKRTHDAVYADVEDYFGAGFNIWMAEDWVYGGTHYSENDAFSALDLAAEYCINHGLTKNDIKVMVTDNFLNGLLDGTDMSNGNRNDVGTYASIAEERINALINYNPTVNGVQVGKEYNCFAGFLLRDEPWYKHMKYYAGWFSFLAADENQKANVTAWNASGAEITGEVSCMGLLSKGYTLYFSLMGLGVAKNYVTDSTSTAACTEAEYVDYVNAFVNNVNATVWNYANMVLAFDNYGLYSDASSSFGSTSVNYTDKRSENWQQNMSLFADLVQGKNPNATFATALRSFGMSRLSMVSRWTNKTWKEFEAFDASWGEQAISMQAYTALAHGYRDIRYFSYWETQNQAYAGETFTDACVMWDDNMNPVKQNMYYWVQSANAELRLVENLISNFTYKETAAIAAGSSFYTGTGNVADTGMGGLWTAAQLASQSALASISATADTTVGYFKKDSGEFKDMFILVNMSHPNESASDTVSMTFDGGYTGVIVYLDGVASIYTLTNGSCSVTLPSGEGAIVIPVA